MMKAIESNGISVQFPFVPYPVQVDYINKVTKALKESGNAVLESPTGTGKTLCLLCATLAWQKVHKKTARKSAPAKQSLEYSDGPIRPLGSSEAPASVPTHSLPSVIFYASRTHSQLSQVVSELKNTGYAPRMTVLGSREQLCIQNSFVNLKGGSLTRACNSLTETHRCMYKNNLDHFTGRAEGVGDRPSPILDIEEIRDMGIRDSVCPYFYSRDNIEDADLILLPYNYLVDPSIRSTLNVEWRNSIVIFDEAHNLESVASDASSFALSSVDIAACIKEMQDAIRTAQEQKQLEAMDKTAKSSKSSLDETKGRPSIDRCLHILQGLFQLESRIDSVTLAMIQGMNKVGKVCPGAWLLELFEGCGFSIEMALSNIQQLQLCSEMFVMNAEALAGGEGGGRAPESKLDYLSKVFIRLFRGKSRQECIANTQFYRAFITDEVVEANPRRLSGGGGGGDQYKKTLTLSGSVAGTKKRVVNYWCFSSGLALEDLRKLGVRSLILTSGTLSPMDSFKEDARIPFSEELENAHVIQNKQIWIGTVTHGPNGVDLNSSYGNRDNAAYQDDLGNAILTFCQTMLGRTATTSGVSVPTGPELRGGVLVFFPSYSLLESIKRRWQQTSIWDKLNAAMGSIVAESKNGTASAPTRKVANYRDFSESSASAPSQSTGKSAAFDPSAGSELGAYELFERAVEANGGRCLLLAVCRGKMSEGIDFRDEKGRIVIITGIPYSPPVDPWVVLKRQFMDENSSSRSGTTSLPASSVYSQSLSAASSVAVYPPPRRPVATAATSTVRRVTGQEWYEQSAIRAVNQAVGRVIRHKNDWGAIVLMDSRFQQSTKVGQLSKWLRPRVKTYQQILPALTEFRAFVTAALGDVSLQRPVKIIGPGDSASSIAPYVQKGATFSAALDGSQDVAEAIQTKKVVVSAEALGFSDNKVVDYVNPQLLLTQNQRQGRAFEMDDGSYMSQSSLLQPQSSGFEEFMSQFNSQSEVDTSVPLKLGLNATKEKKIPSINEIFGQSTKVTKPISIERAVSAPVQDKSSSRPLNLFAKSSSILQREASTAPASQKFGLSAAADITIVSDASESNSSESNGMFLKSLADHLRGKLPQSACDEFSREIKRAAGRSRFIEQLKEIRQFVDRIHSILVAHMGSQAVHDVLTRLTPLIVEKHRGLYASITKNLCSQSLRLASAPSGGPADPKVERDAPRAQDKSTASQDIVISEAFDDDEDIEQEIEILSSQAPQVKRKVEPLARGSSASTSGTAVSGINMLFNKVVSQRVPTKDSISDAVAGNSSKRARMMALSESSPQPKAARKGIQELLSQQHGASKSTASSRSPDFMTKISKLTLPLPQGRTEVGESAAKNRRVCVVCNELSSELAAARCGHVSCMKCWRSWMTQKQTCPQCRAPVKLADLTSIVIK